MAWYVLSADGAAYGPADLPTLRRWVGEGRIAADTVLRDDVTGGHLPAAHVPGLGDAFGGPVQPPPARAGAPAAALAQYHCFHCGFIVVPGVTICPRCGTHLFGRPERRFTRYRQLDGVLGVLTVGGIVLLTDLVFRMQIPGLSRLAALAPLVGPVALWAVWREKNRPYAAGIAVGCCLLPVVLVTGAIVGLGALAHAAMTSTWRCSN